MSYADLLGDAMWWGVSRDRYWQLAPAVAQCLHECDCTTADRIAMWCAQTGHESAGLFYMEEQDWNGDNYAYLEGRCADLGNCSPGDGAKYHGRGPIQVTGKYNYTECSSWAYSMNLAPTPTFFVDQPDELADDDNGFHGVTWYWTTQRPMNDYADAHDIEGATYAINGGYHGLEDREARYSHCLQMGDALLGLLDSTAAEGQPLVGEKVLNYDHNIVGQETGYWCGPASCQVALSCRGIFVEESVLAGEMGTDQDGTDYVALIERSLDPRLPEANYSSVDAPHDPPTEDEKSRFWDGLTRSVNNGYAVVMNWVVPANNRPVGIKGTQSPNYGSYTTFHYVTAVGFDDNPAQRAVAVADSGFQPPFYWITFDQCATLIPPKAACYANLPHPGTTPPEVPVPNYVNLGYEQLCGPIGPNGYGTGWPQLGTNSQGQNLYVVDALSDILHLLEQGRMSEHRRQTPKAKTAPDYAKLSYEQLAGMEGTGWAQLGGRTVVDAVAHIKNVLLEQEGEQPPPFQKAQVTVEMAGEGSLGARVDVRPSSPSGALGRLRERGTPPT